MLRKVGSIIAVHHLRKQFLQTTNTPTRACCAFAGHEPVCLHEHFDMRFVTLKNSPQIRLQRRILWTKDAVKARKRERKNQNVENVEILQLRLIDYC